MFDFVKNFHIHFILLTYIYHKVYCNQEDNSSTISKASNVKSFLRVSSNTSLKMLQEVEEKPKTSVGAKIRVKRQQSAGAGKFTQAAKLPQIKVLRLFLQMFKNTWAPMYVGGAHPLHPDVPKPLIYLFKQTIMEYFFPDPTPKHGLQ